MEGVARQMQTCYCMCMCTDRLGGAGVAGTGIGQSNLVADVHVHGGFLAAASSAFSLQVKAKEIGAVRFCIAIDPTLY